MFFPFHDDNPTKRIPIVTYALIAGNVLVFLWFLRQPSLAQQEMAYRRGFVPARIAEYPQPVVVAVPQRVPHPFRPVMMVREQPLQLEPVLRQILLSLLTCMFLHGGWMHLIGNMWFLWIFGSNVEDRLGEVPYVLLYLVGGLLGSGCHWLQDPGSTTPVIGASGAVATVLGAYAITWPWARVHTLVFVVIFVTIIDLPALLVLGTWFLVQIVAVLNAPADRVAQGVAWWAHIGGFLAGMFLMPTLSSLLGVGAAEKPEQESIDDLPQ